MHPVSIKEVALFALRHPSLLMWAIDWRHDKRIDELIEFLLENLRYIKVLHRDESHLILAVDGCTYHFWQLSRFYDYLTYGEGAPVVTDRRGGVKDLWCGGRPSLKHAYLFYQYFAGPRKVESKKEPATYILSKQEEP